jgi:hypothetical protein
VYFWTSPILCVYSRFFSTDTSKDVLLIRKMKAILSLALACAAAALPQLPVPQPTTGPVQGPAKGARQLPNLAQLLGKLGIDPAKATPVPGG